jgi:hypothetical protein
MFQLVELRPGGEVEPLKRKNGELRLLKTGKAAAKLARAISQGTGRKIQPRPFATVNWRDRELKREEDGTYTRLPWATEPWWLSALQHQPVIDHYAHVSAKYPGRVAFTETENKGLADIQTPMKAGKYLQRFCTGLPDGTIANWAARFSSQFENGILQLAETREDIADVYTRGPDSCMSGKANLYRSRPIHPTEAYASPGDGAVAYMERDGRVTARVVVSRKLMQYTRVYGDYERLRPLLQKAGFKQGNMLGMRLLKIPHKGGFVMPYLDCGHQLKDRGDHFEICTADCYDYSGGDTCGMMGPWSDDDDEGYICSCCDDRIDGDDHYTVDGEVWCPSCFDANATTCDACERNTHSENASQVLNATWCSHCVGWNAYYCDHSAQYVPSREIVNTQDVGRVWRGYFNDHDGVDCRFCNRAWLDPTAVTMGVGCVHTAPCIASLVNQRKESENE